ncbi:MAG: ATP-dependent DNA helicase UvrD2 [Nitriliruptoraceae bacterium]|nr:ATP-dependent DNA helicase UvrD2 [Nitriliruptoraceae bacterium]
MSDPTAPSFPGPDAFGRNVVLTPGTPVPDGFTAAPRLRIDDGVLAAPAHVAAVLHHRWLRRERTVIELAATNEQARAPESTTTAPYALPVDHTFHRERLHFLTWANSYDLRRGTPIWWHGVLATRRAGARPLAAGPGDVQLADGRHAWVDGGPRGPLPTPLPGEDDLPIVHRESVGLGRATVAGTDAPSAELAPDQLAAVTHGSGPARIIAPAGSGKTRVLTERLRHLIRDRHVEPALITALAYNTRAAGEMRARTSDLDTSIRTLHSLALWIGNLDERREVITERDVRTILDRLVRTARIPNTDPYQAYLEALAEVRLGLRDPEEVEAVRGDVDGFAEMFPRYREELARRGVVDFDEQIYRALELLLTRPDLRQQVQRHATHLLVDEFQDLTPAFLLLVRLVAGPSMQVFAVGDDDQTIYSYAGATPEHLVDFDRWFPGAASHALEVNYRCPPEVVAAADAVLSHNRVRVAKTIRAAPRAHETGLDVHEVAATAAATRAVRLVQDRIGGDGRPADVAVLARVNSALLPVQVALTRAGVPHTGALDTTVLGRTGIRTALAYLRLGLDLERIARDDVFDTINRPARKVKSAVQPLLARRGRFSIGQLESLLDQLEPTHRERFADYLGDLRALEDAITNGADTATCLHLIRTRIGLGEAMDVLDASRSRPEGSSHGDDLDALEQLAALEPDPAAFREWLVEQLRVPGDPAGVTLSTVHRVKGMEWPSVVLVAANQGLFPHRLADDVEEERRVFHVAITRCQEHVDVVADRARTSPFVAELRTRASRPTATRAAAADTGPVEVQHLEGEVVAAVGLDVEVAGGLPGRVRAVAADHAVVALDGGAVTRVPFGEPVTVGGTVTRLRARPRTGAGRPGAHAASGARPSGGSAGSDRLVDVDESEVDPALFEALRGWRTRTAAEAGIPAYLVFHDRALRVIAARKPDSLRALSACPGVGPAKLERFGDDILDLVGSHL